MCRYNLQPGWVVEAIGGKISACITGGPGSLLSVVATDPAWCGNKQNDEDESRYRPVCSPRPRHTHKNTPRAGAAPSHDRQGYVHAVRPLPLQVVLLGQVPVRTNGHVPIHSYLVPSGNDDGRARDPAPYYIKRAPTPLSDEILIL